MGVDEIQEIVETPEDAVAAVVLLDQITRNIYRGDLAAKVRPSASTYRQAFAIDHQAYRDFDPKALSLFLAKPLVLATGLDVSRDHRSQRTQAIEELKIPTSFSPEFPRQLYPLHAMSIHVFAAARLEDQLMICCTVMHSEDPSDHDVLASLLAARQALSESDEERAAVQMLAQASVWGKMGLPPQD
jgi:hypothetical protein